VNPWAPKRPRGARKRPRVRTSDHRTCCQNLSRHRLWKAETVLWKRFFHMFPDFTRLIYRYANREPSDNQKLPKGAPGSQRLNPSLEWSWNMHLGWSSLALKLAIEYDLFHFDLKIQSDEQNLQKQKARSSAKAKLFWGKFLPQFEDKQWTADCWPWSARSW